MEGLYFTVGNLCACIGKKGLANFRSYSIKFIEFILDEFSL